LNHKGTRRGRTLRGTKRNEDTRMGEDTKGHEEKRRHTKGECCSPPALSLNYEHAPAKAGGEQRKLKLAKSAG